MKTDPWRHPLGELQDASWKTGTTDIAKMRSHVCFIGLLAVGILIYFFPIRSLGALVFENETYSHITLIPIVSLCLVLSQRKSVFTVTEPKPAIGSAVCAASLTLLAIASALHEHLERISLRTQVVSNDYL